MIEDKETHMDYTLDCSLERQDNLAQEERNTGVHKGEVNSWRQVGQIRERD